MSSRSHTAPESAPALAHDPFAPEVLAPVLERCGVGTEDRICDLGSGAAHWVFALAQREYQVTAVEGDEGLRALGMQRTKGLRNVTWRAQAPSESDWDRFRLVSYAGSYLRFDVSEALREAQRLLLPGGYLAILWNQPDPKNKLQKELLQIAESHGYSGLQQRDVPQEISGSERFSEEQSLQFTFQRELPAQAYLEEWRDELRSAQQGREASPQAMQALALALGDEEQELSLPFVTHVHLAQRL